MTRDEVRAFYQRRLAAWNSGDAARLAADYAESCVISSPMFSRVEGRDGIERSFRSLFNAFPDWKMSFDEPLVDDDRVALPFSATATHAGDFMGLPGSGRRFEIKGILLCRFDNELIAEERRVYDFTGLLIKLGVLRSKPAT
jgi:steroid delta-isomerase-like uncharacterized protein